MLAERFKKGMRVGTPEFFVRWLVHNGVLKINKRATARRGGMSNNALRTFMPSNTIGIIDHDGDITYVMEA